MSYSYFLLLIIILFQSTLQYTGCRYKETVDQTEYSVTNDTYLDSTSGTDAKKQKCYSLSNSDIFDDKCCYSKNTDGKEVCSKEDDSGYDKDCPKETTIPNNCGMGGVYQPVDPTICTEISLVSGYCCYVKTTDGKTFCGSRDEMDDDNKNEVPDDVRDYVSNYIANKPDSDNNDYTNTKVDSIICEGYNLKFYGLLLLISMFLF